MKTKTLTKTLIALVGLFTVSALMLQAQERPVQLDASAPLKAQVAPKADTTAGTKLPPLTLGKSDIALSGPLIDTFRLAPRPSGELTLRQKLLRVPILNIFIPAPMPKPMGQGKYFLWGERDVPWSVTADRPFSGPQGVLVSVGK